MKKLFLLALLVFTFTQAQECKPLLDGLVPMSPPDIQTMEFTMDMTANANGMEVKTSTYYVMDRVNRKIYAKTETMGMTMVMILNDGDFSMQMQMPDGNTQTMPTMPGMSDQLDVIFDQAFDQSELLQDYKIVSCDGQVSIAGLINGEQITAIIKTPETDPDNSDEVIWQEQEIKVIVVNDSQFAYIMNQEPLGEILMIMNQTEKDATGFPTKMQLKMYTSEGGSYILLSDIDYNFVNLNQELDESLFEIGTE